MKVEQKREVIELVRRSPLPKRHTLAELGVPHSTYYRWQRRFRQQGELTRISHQSRDKERVAGFGGERGRWIESWGALARVL